MALTALVITALFFVFSFVYGAYILITNLDE